MDAEQPTDRRLALPPESVVLGKFDGLVNTVTPERMGLGDLQRAANVDLDNAGLIRRRRGYTQLAPGAFHSAWTAPDGRTFVVEEGTLCVLREDTTRLPLVEVGGTPLSYVSVGGVVYFSSRDASGKILPDLTPAPWGQAGGDGQWLSPVLRPTETLGEVQGKLLRRPPLAEWLTHHSGRIYLAQGTVLWATELYAYDWVDATRTFFQYETPITGLASCGDGFYVGTTQAVYFVSGALRELRRQTVVQSGCVPGSMVSVTADTVARAGEPALQHREGVIFLTDEGLIVGFNNGFCRNLTGGRFMFPKSEVAVPMVREADGMHHYVVVTRSGLRPSGMGMGDFCDVEVIRGPRHRD